MTSPEDPVTALASQFARGDKSALDRLMPLLYTELRKLAERYLRKERPGHTLEPTALVHEAYTRLLEQGQPDYRSRAHFMGVVAQIMRQILVDHARRRKAAKRGDGQVRFSIGEADEIIVDRPSVLIAVDEALWELARRDPVKGRLIEMRFFGGFTAEESARATGMTVVHVRRHLRIAQAWLRRELCCKGNIAESK